MRKGILLLIFLIMIPLAYATYTITLLAPNSDIDIYPPNRLVNFSWTATTLGEVLNASDTLNCSILNSTNNVDFTIMSANINTTNASFMNQTILMDYGVHYWKVNCSTMHTPIVTTGVSITNTFNISTKPNYETLSPADGSIQNIVEVNFTWNFSVANVNVVDINCTVQGTYNTTDGAAKSNLGPTINISNGTLTHQVIARDNLKTTFWRMNCTNGSIDFLSSNRSVSVDINYSYDSRLPADGVTNSGLDVNFSWRINVTNINLRPGNALLCAVRNTSDSIGAAKTDLFTPINVTNATVAHQVVRMKNLKNVYWNINCSNGSIDLLSSNFTLGMEINSDYTWQVPDDNSRTGSIVVNFSWRLEVIDINLIDVSGMNCSVQNTSNMTSGAPLHKLFSPINTSNNTIQHKVVTMANRNPVAWRVNCSNGSIDFFSDVYNLGIDYSLDTTIVNPTEGQTLTSRYVNYSWQFEALNVNLSSFNNGSCTLWRNGTAIFSGINTTNATETNRTLSTTNGVYSLVANCTNNVGEIFYNESDARLFTVSESVGDSFIYELLNPAAVSILASTSVNFSWIVNLTNGFLDPGEQLECGLYNKSSLNANYSILFKANITNATFFNQTVTVTADELHWWFVNCTTPLTQSNPISGLSDTRIFEVIADAVYYRYGIGFFDKINFTLNTGDFQLAGDMSIDGGTMFVDSGTNMVGIGTVSPTSKLNVIGNTNITGYTNLGSDAPAIKLKKITGTTDNDSATSVIHDLTSSKILNVDIMVNVGASYFLQNYRTTSDPNHFTFYVTSTNIEIIDVQANVQNVGYKILITYEE